MRPALVWSHLIGCDLLYRHVSYSSLVPTTVLCVLVLLCTLTVSTASTIHFAHTQASAAWTLDTTTSRASPTDAHSFLWLFPTTNDAWLHQQFIDHSTPTSPTYLRHLSYEQVQAATGPSTADKAAVVGWLGGAGVVGEGVRDYGWALSVETSVGVVERVV